ncbi:hypothetical protein FHS85_000125 [Rhodoligotrophos appendicifer]|uniref:sulfotransferase n=1 Tax=Rhodoligotrophos appendicifer TaxID=987056 RepID=UPI001478165D|nr:sulfotransferase [Rhodoligotrophos appendicifer]
MNEKAKIDVDSGNPDWVDHAVLVYGPRKAGTTLFQNLLDGGQELLAYPAELKLKAFVKYPLRGEAVSRYAQTSRVPEVNSRLLSIEGYRSSWRKAAERADWHPDLRELIRLDAETVLENCGAKPSRLSLWCAKEVGGDTDKIVSLWRKMFPLGRILFIFRDPLMITRAVLNDRRRKGITLSAAEIAHETLDPLRVVAAQSRYLGDRDVFALSYEDLVRDPRAVMARVASFLGIQMEDVFTRPTIFGEDVVVRTASRSDKEVFVEDREWFEGLTKREQFVVKATSRLSKVNPRYRLDYPQLRRAVAEGVRRP